MNNQYSFFNLPQSYNLDSYKKSTSKIIKKYSNIAGLMSIQNWGNISIPGISDIDLLFVFSTKCEEAMPMLKRSYSLLDKQSRYLVRHPFVFIDDNSAKNLGYIYPDTKLTTVFGSKIQIKKISKNEEFYVKVSLLNDLIIRHYPRDFIVQDACKKINVRDTLLRLNSLKYTIKILEQITNKKNHGWESEIRQIQELRANWFDKKNFQELIRLNRFAVGLTLEITNLFSKFLKKKGIVNIKQGTHCKFSTIKNKSIFIQNWDKKTALDAMLKLIKSNQKYHSILPLELVPQIIEYSKYHGEISSHIKMHIEYDLKYSLKHGDIIKKRIGILNSQAKLASILKHSDFAAFFDFGYRASSGINNSLLGIIDNFRHS